jgi:hypothetical protein
MVKRLDKKMVKKIGNKIKLARFTGLLFLMSAAQSFGMHQEFGDSLLGELPVLNQEELKLEEVEPELPKRGVKRPMGEHAQYAGMGNYVCEICGEQLSNAGNLKRHMKVHEQPK